MNKITIRANLVKGMALLASKDTARGAINAVCLSIRDKIPRLIATDGRILGMLLCEGPNDIAYTVEEAGDFQLLIPIPDFRRLGCGSGKITIDQDEKNTRISYGDFTQTLATPLSKFPDVQPAIPPDNTPISGLDLNMSLLHLFTEALKAMGFKDYRNLHLRGGGTDQYGNQNPLHVFPSSIPTFYGVISGLRTERDFIVPPWARPALPPEPEPEPNTPTPTPEPPQPANPTQVANPA